MLPALAISATAIGFVWNAALGQASQPSSSAPTFPDLIGTAVHDIGTKEGQHFDIEIGRQFARKHREEVKRCVESEGKPPIPPLSFVVVLDERGSVARVVTNVEIPLALCIRALLVKESFPKPPFAPFHDLMEMSFEWATEEAPPSDPGAAPTDKGGAAPTDKAGAHPGP